MARIILPIQLNENFSIHIDRVCKNLSNNYFSNARPTLQAYSSCSTYTIQAIKEWGAAKGTWMGIKRISRCHPWGTHGYDPVPKKNIE